MKKIILGTLFLALFGFAFTPTAKATTVEELLAQISILQVQILQLQKQLAENQATTGAWCHNFNGNIKWKDRGSEVEAFQVALEKEGFQVSADEKTNKYFYTSTLEAAMDFQCRYKTDISKSVGYEIGCTGFVGSGTRTQLNKTYGCGVVIKPYITVSSPNGGETWNLGNSYFIKWTYAETNSNELSGKNATLCLIALDKNNSPIPAKSGWNSGTCAYLPSSGGKSTYAITNPIRVTNGTFYWTIPSDLSNRFESNPVSYKVGILVPSASPLESEEWGTIMVQDESDSYFKIVAETGLNNLESQLADISKVAFQLSEVIKNLLGR